MIRLVIAAALAFSATAASAQTACAGDLVGMRVSTLKPGGSAAGFAEAFRDHKAWYASHGLKADRFTSAPVFESVDGSFKPSVTKTLTIHVYGTAAAPKRDAAWEAYVAKYRANATIESETRTCLPKGTMVIR